MSFFVNGIETPVIVDDYLPTRYDSCCFTRSKDEELWCSLLEKGWAKLHGSYARTEGGQSAQASYHVQGVPADSVNHPYDLKTEE